MEVEWKNGSFRRKEVKIYCHSVLGKKKNNELEKQGTVRFCGRRICYDTFSLLMS